MLQDVVEKATFVCACVGVRVCVSPCVGVCVCMCVSAPMHEFMRACWYTRAFFKLLLHLCVTDSATTEICVVLFYFTHRNDRFTSSVFMDHAFLKKSF